MVRIVTVERLAPEEPILWGTIFWRPYVNAATLNPAEILHLEVKRQGLCSARTLYCIPPIALTSTRCKLCVFVCLCVLQD